MMKYFFFLVTNHVRWSTNFMLTSNELTHNGQGSTSSNCNISPVHFLELLLLDHLLSVSVSYKKNKMRTVVKVPPSACSEIQCWSLIKRLQRPWISLNVLEPLSSSFWPKNAVSFIAWDVNMPSCNSMTLWYRKNGMIYTACKYININILCVYYFIKLISLNWWLFDWWPIIECHTINAGVPSFSLSNLPGVKRVAWRCYSISLILLRARKEMVTGKNTGSCYIHLYIYTQNPYNV